MLFAILLTISSSAASSPLTRRDSDAFTDCFSSVGVRALTPNDPAYAQSAQPFNQRLEYLPSAIALPRNTSEVAAAVRCAAQYNVATCVKLVSESRD